MSEAMTMDGAAPSEVATAATVDIALTLFLTAVVIGAILKWIYSFLEKPLPLTILVFLLGGLLSIWADHYDLGLIGEGIHMAEDVHPNVIFFILLPPLLFEAASLTDWPVFRHVFAQSVWLAGPGALVSTAFMSGAVYVIFNFILPGTHWSFADCLMFCSMFAATDTVAVVTTLDSLGVPNRVAAPINGESLINDGSAIVMFKIFKDLATGTPASFGSVFVQFVRLAFGGTAWGYACAIIVSWMLSMVQSDANIEITLLMAGSIITYFIADYAFEVSGVLAVITFGMYMASKGMYVVTPDVAKFEESFKSQVAFYANTLIFFLAGVVSFHRVSYAPEITNNPYNWLAMIALFVFLILARVVMVAVLWPILRITGYGMQVAEAKVLVWSGLRGAMTVALALAMDLDQRISRETAGLMIFHIAGLVSMTLLINGPTIDSLYIWLDIHPPNPYRAVMFSKAMTELECAYMKPHIDEIVHDPFFAIADMATVKQLVLDMTKATIIGRGKPKFDEQDTSVDARALLATMLERRQAREYGMWREQELLKAQGKPIPKRKLASMDVGNAVPASEELMHVRTEEHDTLKLLVSPRGPRDGQPWQNSLRGSNHDAGGHIPVTAVFGADHAVVDIDLDGPAAEPEQQEETHDDHAEHECRTDKRDQLRMLREMSTAMSHRQRVDRRRAMVSRHKRDAQVALLLFSAIKADFREQFEAHRLSHEAVWMLFDAANDGSEECDKAPFKKLSTPFKAEWNALSLKLEQAMISPWLRRWQHLWVVRQLGNWVMLRNMFLALEVLHAFIESHVKVVERASEEVLADPTKIKAMLAKIVRKAEAILAGHLSAMPNFSQVVVTVLCARRILHLKRQKLLSLTAEGVISKMDLQGLILAIDVRLGQLSTMNVMFHIAQIRHLDRERSKLLDAGAGVFATRNRDLLTKRMKKVMATTKFRKTRKSDAERSSVSNGNDDAEEDDEENLEQHVMTVVAQTVAANARTKRYDSRSFIELVDHGSEYEM